MAFKLKPREYYGEVVPAQPAHNMHVLQHRLAVAQSVMHMGVDVSSILDQVCAEAAFQHLPVPERSELVW